MKGEDTLQHATKLFSIAQQTMHETDDRRVSATLQMADAYETQGQFSKAEELLVNAWGQLTKAYHDSPTLELQDMKYEAAIAYVDVGASRFLC